MLERLDRRSITLLDVVALCDREAQSIRSQDMRDRQPVIHPSTSHVWSVVIYSATDITVVLAKQFDVNCCSSA